MIGSAVETSRKALGSDELGRLDACWRAANYLSVGQIYLLANPYSSGSHAKGPGAILPSRSGSRIRGRRDRAH
jgi:hypothetical protein